ncbi:MAG: lamin tail domain-containing protein [Flavobacteriales bacterium]
MLRPYLLLFVIFVRTIHFSQNQVHDDFHDQNLNQGILWQGDTSHFYINIARQLQLNQTLADTSLIWTQLPNFALDTLSIQFWYRENFSPSSLNFGRFYFQAQSADFQNSTDCFYLQFGESSSTDAIKLYQRQNGTDSLLASGPLGQIANAFAADLKLIITANSIALFAQFSNSTTLELQFQANVSNQNWQPYAGFEMHYTAANAAAFYIDDFYFGIPLDPLSSAVIITEIMANPDTLYGLPATEYLEIYNNSPNLIQLRGLKIQDGNGICTLPSFWLEAQSYVVLVGTNKSIGFGIANIVEVAAFPGLNNSGEPISLKNHNSEMLDQVVYQASWYGSSQYSTDAISLERKSLSDPCSNQDNWGACTAAAGGTPGATNAIFDPHSDTIAPTLLQICVLDAHYVAFNFSEPMDSLSLANSSISILPGIGPYERQILNYQNCLNGAQMLLYFYDTILPSYPYFYQIDFATDCWNNTQELVGDFVRYEKPQKGDLLINEILFDPPNEGHDFVELLNQSEKYLDLSDCGLHNLQDSIFLNQEKIEPKQFLALCPDTLFLLANYPLTASSHLKQIDLPYFYNDSGTCVLFNDHQTLDSLHYLSRWHFSLLPDPEGFSLERISSSATTQDPENWFSAAQTVGGATPGCQNSQHSQVTFEGEIHLTHPDMSPDLDAYHDQLEIVYQMKDPGLIACVGIYTLNGQLLQNVLFNESIATQGVCYWDGSTTFGTLVPAGIYVMYFRAFSTKPGAFFEKKILFSVCYKA